MTIKKYKTKNGIRWGFEIQHNGKRHSKGGFLSKREALEREVSHRKTLNTDLADTTLSILIIMRANELHARTTTMYYLENMAVFKKFTTYLNGTATMVSEIKRQDIEDFLNSCYRTEYTYNYALRMMRALFNLGIEKGWFLENPTKGMKFKRIDKKKKYIPPKEDLDKVIRLAEDVSFADYAFLITLKNTLARVSEIYALTWGDIDFLNKTITLWTRKKRGGARTPRTLPMTEELYNVLSTLPYKSEYVFTNEKTMDKFEDKKKLLIGLCKKAGVKRFTFHCLRHFGASTLAKKGVPLSDIQEILGHDNVTTTAIYIQSLVGSTSKSIHLLNK